MSDVPEMVVKVAKAISGAPFPSAASIAKAYRAIEAMRSLPEAPGLRYASGCYSRQQIEAFVDDALTAPASASERRS